MERFKGALVVGFLRLFSLLPFRWAQGVGAAIGWLMWILPNRSKEVVRINLARCMPELSDAERERLVRATLLDTGRSLAESACAWMWKPEKTLALIREVEGEHLLHEALEAGTGLVCITSHLGNWEVLNHWYCSRCSPIIFYRPPKLKAVDELLQRQRTQLGNKVAASTREGIISVMREVRRGGRVDLIRHCPHGPDDGCGCRKPLPGLFEQISAQLATPLAGVPVVGDSLRDLEAGIAVGCRPILVRTGKGAASEHKALPAGTLIFDDLAAVADHLLSES